jgi:branched-subunit amino acid aminotransferase/4-amino-4-deoxychorismate lyase
VTAYDLARQEREEAGLGEVLLFDGAGRLVEGTRSNVIVVSDSGRILTPALEFGPVEGLGLTIVREDHPELAAAELTHEDLERAREMMWVNCVRGVIAIVEFDGRAIANGQPGPISIRLGSAFFHG